jgi:hypothetical protein
MTQPDDFNWNLGFKGARDVQFHCYDVWDKELKTKQRKLAKLDKEKLAAAAVTRRSFRLARKRGSCRLWTYANPKETKVRDIFEFPQLEVRPTCDGRGLGLFAVHRLPPRFVIPIIGDRFKDQSLTTHTWTYTVGLRKGEKIDGNPRLGKEIRLTGKGLGVALMANWPKQGERANCKFFRDNLISVRTIHAGEQLLVRYWNKGQQDDACEDGMSLEDIAFAEVDDWDCGRNGPNFVRLERGLRRCLEIRDSPIV